MPSEPRGQGLLLLGITGVLAAAAPPAPITPSALWYVEA